MQIGSVSPLSAFAPRSIADALQQPENEKEAPAQNAQTEDAEQGVSKKDPISVLRAQLAKESEPTALEKFQQDFAKKALESFSKIAQAWRENSSSKNSGTSLLDSIVIAQPDSAKEAQEAEEAARKAKEAEELAKAEEQQRAQAEKLQAQSAGNALTLQDFNLIPMTNFQQTTTASYTASYDSVTGQATQEMMYSNSYSFVFKGSVTDQNGKTFNIEANITLTHSLYTRVTGGADTLTPEIMQQLQDGNPLALNFEGDGNELLGSPLALYLDNLGASNQITGDPVFGDLAKTALGEGLGSLLEGLRIFKDDMIADILGKQRGDSASAADSANLPADDASQNALQDWKPNLGNLLGLGEQGTGIVWFSHMQSLLYAQTHDDNGTMRYSAFSYTQSVVYANQQSSLDLLLEQLKQHEKEQDSVDAKKAVDAYSNNSQQNGLLGAPSIDG